MCPTRELANQVAKEAMTLAPSKKFRTVAVYGGAGMGKQQQGLRGGCDLVVGTPGRIMTSSAAGTSRSITSSTPCWTKRTACWTSASGRTSRKSSAAARTTARR